MPVPKVIAQTMSRTVSVFGNPGGISVVHDVNFSVEQVGKKGVNIGVDPRLIDVGGRHGDAATNDRGYRHANLVDFACLREVSDDLPDDYGDGSWGSRLWCRDPKPIRDQVTGDQVHRSSFDPGATNIDPKADFHESHSILYG